MAFCKNCQGELPEDSTLCPACGKENAEELLEEVAAAEMEEVIEEEKSNGLITGLAIGAVIIGVGYGIKKFFDRRKANKVSTSETVEVLDVEKVEPEEIEE